MLGFILCMKSQFLNLFFSTKVEIMRILENPRWPPIEILKKIDLNQSLYMYHVYVIPLFQGFGTYGKPISAHFFNFRWV